jgi:hypothetical protein
MGWTSQTPNLVVIEASTGYTGLYIYDPTAGVNNLIASIAPSGVTEPYGNPVVGGGAAFYLTPDSLGELTFIGPRGYQMRSGQSYEGQHGAVKQDQAGAGGALEFIIQGFASTTASAADYVEMIYQSNNEAGTLAAQAIVNYIDANAGINEYLLVTDSGTTVLGQIAAVSPTQTTSPTNPAIVEPWNSLGSITATGFTANIGQYKFTTEGETEIDVKLTAKAGGGTAGVYSYGTTMPAVYRPPTTRIYPLGWNSTMVAGAASNALIVNSTGVVQVKLNALVAATIVGTTVRVPLNV